MLTKKIESFLRGYYPDATAEQLLHLYEVLKDSQKFDLNLLRLYSLTLNVELASGKQNYQLSNEQILYNKKLHRLSVLIPTQFFTKSSNNLAIASQLAINNSYLTLINDKNEKLRDLDSLGFYTWDNVYAPDKSVFTDKPIIDWTKTTLFFPDSSDVSNNDGKVIPIRVEYWDFYE